MKTTPNEQQFPRGLRVIYAPGISRGDTSHPSCEKGTVSSINALYVFVKFDKQLAKFGWEGTTSQSCDPSDLVSLHLHDGRWPEALFESEGKK